MVAPLIYAAGVAGAAALNYGSRLFTTDPKLIGDNASRYLGGSPSSNLDRAPKFWLGENRPESNSKVSQKEQYQQIDNARFLRSGGNQSGFDDEADNIIEDKARSKFEFQQRAIQANNRDKNKVTNTMATPNDRYSKPVAKQAAPVAANLPRTTDRYKVDSDAMTNLVNYANQSSDRRYNTDKTADVTYKLGSQRNQVDYAVGMDKNAVTRDVGKYQSDNQLKASTYKSYAELQAALNNNILQSGDRRYETTTKYGTQERMNTFNRNTVDQTELATAQVKAGTYGMSKSDQQKAASDKTNFDNWKNYNDAQFNYTDRMNQQIKLQQDIAKANVAVLTNDSNRANDQRAAMFRFQVEQNNRNADRAAFAENQRLAREQVKQDYGLRAQQIQSQIELANRDFSLRSAESAAKTFDIYNTAALKNNQFSATRADVSYNRQQQQRSNLAF
jgi:hypothetical protein